MRNILFLLGLVLLLTRPALGQTPAPGPAATVEVSRTHCLVRFVETLAGGNNYVGSRRVFEHSRFKL